MTLRHALLVAVLLAASGAGCMGYREYYDPAADRYEEILGEAGPLYGAKKVRYTVNVARYVGGRLVEPVSAERKTIKKLARQSIYDMKIFAPESVRSSIDRYDYHFIFDVKIEVTQEPGLFSGLILPFYKACEYSARVQVLTEKGEPFAGYIASAETFQERHLVLLPFTPFYWPGWADGRARRNVFEALAAKLVADRKEFL